MDLHKPLELINSYYYGSVVYGTIDKDSDRDFISVVEDDIEEQKNTLPFADGDDTYFYDFTMYQLLQNLFCGLFLTKISFG